MSTAQQGLAIDFAQEMFDSVGLPVNSLLKIARALSPGSDLGSDFGIDEPTGNTIH